LEKRGIIIPILMPLRTRELVAPRQEWDELGFGLKSRQESPAKDFALGFRYTRVRGMMPKTWSRETFRKALSHLQKVEGKYSLSTWLTRVAINESL